MTIINRIQGFFKKKVPERKINIIDLGIFDNPFSGDDMSAMFHNRKDVERKKKERISIKPMDIIHDLEEGVVFSRENIKEAIIDLEKRMRFTKDVLQQSDDTDELRALDMLNARLKYPKYAKLFLWKTTTASKVETMLDKYDLEWHQVKYYIRAIPEEAITCMQRYKKIFEKVSNKNPDFTLIAPPSYFENPANKTDPILLAKSPFGQFYYIITAWDKEISLVSELLDGEELIIDKKRIKQLEAKK